MPTRRRHLGLVAAVLLLLSGGVTATWWWLSREGPEVAAPALEWREPEAVAAWARRFLAGEGVTPESIDAEIRRTERGSRHVLLARHASTQPLPLVLRATARLLVAARAEGPESAAHLAVVQREGATWALPVGEAAELATNPVALANFLALTVEELGLPPEGIKARVPAGSAPVPARVQDADQPALATGPQAPAASKAGAPGPGETQPAPGASAPAGSVPEATAASPRPEPIDARTAPEGDSDALLAAGAGIPARVTRGHGPVTTRADASTTAAAFRLQVAAGARRRLTLHELTIRASGPLSEVEDIDFVDLYRETDVSGRGASRPEKLGESQAFGDDDGSVTFSNLLVPFGEDGLPLALLVQVRMAPEVGGGTFELSLPDAESVVIEDARGEAVRVIGAPVKGPRIEVESTLLPDPEQERLDRLAQEGPDAVDPNLERMREEAAEAARQRAEAASAPPGASAPR